MENNLLESFTGTPSHLGYRKTATGMKKDEEDYQDSNNLVTILTFNGFLVCLLLALVSSTKVLVGQFQQISFNPFNYCITLRVLDS